jgi:hypothetical protein
MRLHGIQTMAGINGRFLRAWRHAGIEATRSRSWYRKGGFIVIVLAFYLSV